MSLTKPTLSNLRAAGTTVGDLYFPNVSLLLPFEGTNGATSTNDLSNKNHTVTFHGSAAISTAQKKIGTSSVLLGNGSNYLSMPSGDWCEFGTNDFTIELWLRRTGLPSDHMYIFECRNGSDGAKILIYCPLGTNNPALWVSSSSRITSSIPLLVDTWHHLALVRSGGTTTMYIDGASGGTWSDSTSYISSNLYLGCYTSGGAGYAFPGNFDSLRVTKNVARYTSAFTPPASAHLTSAGDANKQIIINSAADGVAIGTGGINQARVAKAWAEFDGSGITLNASYNVSSITDHGNRDYTINFSTAMADTNYSIVGSNIGQTATYNWSVVTGMGTAKTTSAARINVPHINDSSLYGNDPDAVNVIVFGN
jgi:hypothetical protein